jgi:hypothetical protein
MTIKTQHYPLGGGVDMVTAAIAVKSGRARQSVNYEPLEQGYQRVDGFERFDGRPKPSKAAYWILDFDAGTDAISEGDIVTGADSSATGEALIDQVIESGSLVGNDAAGYLVLVNVSSTSFNNNEKLQVSAANKADADGAEKKNAADTDALSSTYLQDAIETTRADILVVPGSGNMRGVWVYGGNTYAFRNNAVPDAVDMYKATSAGWVLQDLGETFTFTSGGTTEIAEEDTVTGDASGETAVVKRVIVTSGTWAGGDAAGRLIVYSVSGAFQAENLEVSSVNLASIAADAVPNTLAAGGRFELVNSNFGGHASTRRMYGCDGVSLAFEWDGAVFVPIITGMTADTPKHIFVHKKHLFLSFTGGSAQHSGIGKPYVWTILSGAAEIAIGEEITGFGHNGSAVLTIFGRNTIALLYGADAATWDLNTLTDEAGAIEWTNQLIGTPVYMDDRGLRTLETTEAFGDFTLGTLSKAVAPVIKAKKKAVTRVTPKASVRVRAKDQYRLFWSDGFGLAMYLGRGLNKPEIMEFDLGKVVHTACSGEDSNGEEIMFIGSTDGYIYQLDAGTSFDGSSVTAYIRLPFNHVGSPTQHKRWHKLTLEMDADIDTVLNVLVDFGFGDPEGSLAGEETFTVSGGGGYWNLDNWNEFQWSAQAEGVALLHIDGEGTNMSVSILSDKTYEAPHTLHGLTLHYSNLRLQR